MTADDPLDALPAHRLGAASEAFGAASVACRIAPRLADCDPALFARLLSHIPEAAAALEVLEGATYRAWRPPAGDFGLSDRLGATAVCTVAHHEGGLLGIVAIGSLGYAPLPRIRGTGIIGIRYREAPEGLWIDGAVRFRVEDRRLHRVSAAFSRVLAPILRARMQALVDDSAKLTARLRRDPEGVMAALVAAGRASDVAAMQAAGLLPQAG